MSASSDFVGGMAGVEKEKDMLVSILLEHKRALLWFGSIHFVPEFAFDLLLT